MSTTNKRIQKGWMILVVCMLIQAIPYCIAANIQPLFISSVIAEHGFSLTGFSLIFTIGSIVSAVVGPFIGSLFRKVHLKIMYTVGAVLCGGGFILFSMCDTLPKFYAVAAIVNTGAAIISSIGVPLLINSWFDGNIRGKALGLAFAGGSFGNIFMQQLVIRSIAGNGTSNTYFTFGVVSLAVSLVIGLFLVKMPKDESEIVKGNNKDVEAVENNTEEVDISYTLKEAQSTKYFWMIAVGFLFVGLYVSAYSVQHANYFQSELKLTASAIGLTGSIFAICSLFGTIIGGILFDKLGVVKTLLISAIAVAASGVSIVLAGTNPIFAHLFSAVKGLATFIYMMAPAYLVGEYFGKKEYGSILGMVQLIFAVGFSSGSVLFGVLVSIFGYNTTWMIILGFVVMAFFLLITASKGMIKLNKERQENMAKMSA